MLGFRHSGTNLLSRLLAGNTDARVLPGSLAEIDAWRAGSSRARAAWLDRRRAWIKRRRPALREWLIDFVVGRAPAPWFWKHAALDAPLLAALDGVHPIVAVKHPLPWLASMYRRPHHAEWFLPASLDFSRFIRTEWRTVRREHAPERLPDLVRLWAHKAEAYASLLERRPDSSLVRFDALIEDQLAVLDGVAAAGGVEVRRWAPIHRDVKGGSRSGDDIRAYYRQERWRELYSDEDVAFVRDVIPPGLLDRLGLDPW